MRLGSLFSGCGGLDMAVNAVFGSSTAWHVEFEKAPSKVLAANWPDVPNYRDVTSVDWSAVEPVDILAGGFPCQDLSLAGRRAGMRPGTRSGLWSDFVKAIDALKPSVVVIENVRGLLSGCAEGGINADGSPMEQCQGCVGDGEHRPVLRALGRVLGDLADLGFNAEWGGIRAADVGAPHGRYRVFVVAYRNDLGSEWLGRARDGWSRSENGHREPVGLPDGTFMFSTPDTMPDAPNKNSNRVKQPGGLNDQVMSLFRTPVADEDGGGPLHPDVAAERGQTLRLTGQILALTGHLMPTPVAQQSGNSPEDHLREKPEREVAVFNTPTAADAIRTTVSRNARKNYGATTLPEQVLALSGHLLPTPTAMNPNDEEDLEKWEERRARVKAEKKNGNGFGTPLGVAVRQLGVNWGQYEPAVRRWEAATRPAPAPTQGDGRDGKHRLSSEFVEWMQGYAAGHVTGLGLTRSEELRILGNTVVPQQGAEAIRQLWARAIAAVSQ